MSAKARPLVRNVKELIQAVREFMHIMARDVLEGLDMDQPAKADQLPVATLFGRVLSPPADRPKITPVPEDVCRPDVVLRLRGRAHPFPQLGPTRYLLLLRLQFLH